VLIGNFYTGFDRTIAHEPLAPATITALHAHRDRLTTLKAPEGTSPGDEQRVTQALRRSYANAFRDAMFAGAALCVIASVVASLTIARNFRPAPTP
jgi:hypothetical protein